MRAYWVVVAACLAGCSPSSDGVAAQMDAHSEQLRTKERITEALNRPEGPDYAAAVNIVERSERAPLQQDYDIGNLMLAACRDGVSFCDSGKTARAGMARLYHVATAGGEDARTAAGDLSLWFTRGAGKIMTPDPQQAACWTRVRDGQASAASCPSPTPTP